MARLIAPIVALALGMSSAFALVSCGDGDAELLPGETAEEIIENLDTVETLADDGDCEGAQRAAAEVSSQVDDLSSVDRELVQALRRGTDRLETVVADCEEETTTETTTETTVSERDTNEKTQSQEDDREREKKQEVEKEREKDGKDEREETSPPSSPPAAPPGQGGGEPGDPPAAEPPSGGVEPNAPAGGGP